MPSLGSPSSLAFRILDFPDLTVDGSFPLGAAVAAVAITAGINPWLATAFAAGAGAGAGLVTATLNQRFKILHLLASILTMIALFSVILRVMGRPNVAILTQRTMLTPFFGLGLRDYIVRPLFLAILVAVTVPSWLGSMTSDFGLAMRATGANPKMARAQGIRTEFQVYVGMALSNALVGIGGSLFAQTNGFADVTTGVGTIVVGLRRGHHRRNASALRRCPGGADRLRPRVDRLPRRHSAGAVGRFPGAAAVRTSTSSRRSWWRWR